MIPDYLPESGTALEGRVALVTGAASGIGEAVSRIYASNGAKVAMIDLDAARLAEVAADIRERGGDVLDIVADVVDESVVREFFAATIARYGRLDLLINSAGRDSLAPPVTQVTLEEWNKTIGPNLTGVFLCCREAFLHWEGTGTGGRIINMGSSSTKVASGPGHSPYRASKHGMLGVTVLNPSHVRTPMTEIIDQGLYDGDLPAYTDGWLDEKEIAEGIAASCIDVANVAEAALYIATRTPDVTIPTFSLYPTHKAHRYGMEV
jgi:NADP-dependent 3-hydroxy acid dehydrogenase YdfG